MGGLGSHEAERARAYGATLLPHKELPTPREDEVELVLGVGVLAIHRADG